MRDSGLDSFRAPYIIIIIIIIIGVFIHAVSACDQMNGKV